MAVPHWPAMQLFFGMQQVALEQTWPMGHGQLTVPPQPSAMLLPHWPALQVFGMQQVVLWQT
jgi:hypothetical protein